MLTRAEFMKLTKLDSDSFTALKRREILPLLTSEGRNSYTVQDALLTNVILGLFQEYPHMPQTTARGVIKLIADEVLDRIDQLPNDLAPKNQIMAGAIYKQYPVGLVGFVGTSAQLTEEMTRDSAPVSVALINLTLTAEAMRATASYDGIDLGGF